jgi:formylglycine-generating enzyme required for sulfatase activity
MPRGLFIIAFLSVFFVGELRPQQTLFSLRLNGSLVTVTDSMVVQADTGSFFSLPGGITGRVSDPVVSGNTLKWSVKLENGSSDTVDIENMVPFGEAEDHVFITASGPWALARARLFLPGAGPVGVILPDNAWELGYGDRSQANGSRHCILTRRTHSESAERRRYKTMVYPGGFVEYSFWSEDYIGTWQDGLKRMFRQRFLFDLEEFNDSLYRRDDISWIRSSYLIGLQFAWNRIFYDRELGKYMVITNMQKDSSLFGHYDVMGLWPTWPRLGVDQRNQWDLFADMPGGLERIRELSLEMKALGTRFFICYNPWDESTRAENPYEGMAGLIRETVADGVVLDCHGASSYLLQRAADSVRPGVVMYSEGMAVVKDMPGIAAGRVHDAIYLSPPLNLNKLIRPDFAIFRVCQVRDGRIRREAAISFFNGYGTELNTFAPGNAGHMEEDLVFLGRTIRILRENSPNFLDTAWTPLLESARDSVWVNSWPLGRKTVFTVLSLVPEGYSGPLFHAEIPEGSHVVSLWRNEEVVPVSLGGNTYLHARTEAFHSADLGTRAEGAVDCIAILPRLITARINGNFIEVEATDGDRLVIWAGTPGYANRRFIELPAGSRKISVFDPPFFNYEGKYVIQLFDGATLADETYCMMEPGTPRLIPVNEPTPPAKGTPAGMARVSPGSFTFRAWNTDQFIPYPDEKEGKELTMSGFFMDRYPVTNAQYLEFIRSAGYRPVDSVNFLAHWDGGKIPPGLEMHPVVYVSPEDAAAYARWAGKRLPTETEWQYAAQGPDGRDWPWGGEYDSTRCNHALGSTTPVDAFPLGESPFGIRDLVGNVWQLTADTYDNGTYRFVIMKGGSHYRPASSWWYVKGGPQPVTWHQQLLLVSPGFDRNSTVGFRCVKDL